MKTKAAVLFSLRAPLQICELDIPPLEPGQVLVEMAYSGLCHSQLNEIDGLKGEDPYLPHTLGHEGSGVVLEVGPEVTKVKPGDPVVLSWLKGKGKDVPRAIYQWKGKAIQSGAISTFMTKTVVSENRLIPISSSMPLREAALLGCALPTGAGVVRREMQAQKGHSLAIFGLGGVGLAALVAAKAQGISPLIAVDVNPEKLTLARQLGATHAYNAREERTLDTILDLTQGKGTDFVLESAGNRSAMEAAFRVTRAGGGLCIVAGNLPKGETIQIDPFELIRGKQIRGTWGGKSDIDEDVAFYAERFTQGSLNLSSLITQEGPLESINELFSTMREGKGARLLINFN